MPARVVAAVLLIIRGRRDMGVWEVSEHTTRQDWIRMLALLGVADRRSPCVMPFLGYVVASTAAVRRHRHAARRTEPARSFAYGWVVAALVFLVFDVGIGISPAHRAVGVLTWTPSGLLLDGFADALTPTNLLWALIGVTIGTAVGVLPGIGPALTVALLLPITFTARARPAR